MKLWPFRRQKNEEVPDTAATIAPASSTADTEPEAAETVTIIPFPGDIEDTATLKYHGVRALGAFLMDRHSTCRKQHPFCGPHGHYKNGDTPAQLVAHVIPQMSQSGDDLIAIYFCKAEGGLSSTAQGTLDPFEYTAWLNCIEPESRRKLVVQLQSDGSYLLHYGLVLNPVKDDHSTGIIDTSQSWYTSCNPEPPHVKWEYRDIGIADGKLRVVPSFRCLQVFGEWWVVDTDGENKIYQQIAAFDHADNPNHELGDKQGQIPTC